MARKRVLQGPTITIPRSANVNYQTPIQKSDDKHWIWGIFEDRPRTRWEWWREFLIGFAFGWIFMSWFWSSKRKRRSVYLDHLGR